MKQNFDQPAENSPEQLVETPKEMGEYMNVIRQLEKPGQPFELHFGKLMELSAELYKNDSEYKKIFDEVAVAANLNDSEFDHDGEEAAKKDKDQVALDALSAYALKLDLYKK